MVRICLDCGLAFGQAVQVCPQCDRQARGALYPWDCDVVQLVSGFWVPESGKPPDDLPRGFPLLGPGAAAPKRKTRVPA